MSIFQKKNQQRETNDVIFSSTRPPCLGASFVISTNSPPSPFTRVRRDLMTASGDGGGGGGVPCTFGPRSSVIARQPNRPALEMPLGAHSPALPGPGWHRIRRVPRYAGPGPSELELAGRSADAVPTDLQSSRPAVLLGPRRPLSWYIPGSPAFESYHRLTVSTTTVNSDCRRLSGQIKGRPDFGRPSTTLCEIFLVCDSQPRVPNPT